MKIKVQARINELKDGEYGVIVWRDHLNSRHDTVSGTFADAAQRLAELEESMPPVDWEVQNNSALVAYLEGDDKLMVYPNNSIGVTMFSEKVDMHPSYCYPTQEMAKDAAIDLYSWLVEQ